MKKADFRLPNHCRFAPEKARPAINNLHGDTTMNIDAQMITSSAPFVKSETAKKHLRIVREPLNSQDITVPLKALGRHIVKCQRKRQSVRVLPCGAAFSRLYEVSDD